MAVKKSVQSVYSAIRFSCFLYVKVSLEDPYKVGLGGGVCFTVVQVQPPLKPDLYRRG